MSDFETRKRPLRDTVCDIDADIINLIMRRHNMLTRMAGRKKNPGSQDEKMIREDWEARVAKVSGDPKLSGLFFSLMEEASFFPKPAEGAVKRQAFGLSPRQEPVSIDMKAPLACRFTRSLLALAAASGQPFSLGPTLMNTPVYDCMQAFNAMGAELSDDGHGTISAPSAKRCGTPDKVIVTGCSSYNFYLALGHYLGHPSRAKFTSDSNLPLSGLDAVDAFLPKLGARLVHIIPGSAGLPVRVECSGLLPDCIVFPADVPFEFIEGMLLAAPFYDVSVTFDLSETPQRDRIVRRIVPLLQSVQARVEVDSEKIHISPSKIIIPADFSLPVEPELAIFLLALVPALSGSVTLRGNWPDTPEAEAAMQVFTQCGLKPDTSADGIISLKGEKLTKLPEGGIEIPGDLPGDWLCLPVLLSMLPALAGQPARMPRGYVPCQAPWVTAESFARACGLDIDDDGNIVERRESRPRRRKEEEEPLETPHSIWIAPSAPWAAALAVAACARPVTSGFRLGNPYIMSGLFPGFWNGYNNLPSFRPAKEEEVHKHRRIRTNVTAVLPEIDEDDL